MHALDWLGDLAQWLLALVPRLQHIRQTHGAVRFTRHHAVVLKPGLHLYWPVWSSIQTLCVVRQTLNLPYQCLMASDGVGVVVAVTVVYEIDDVGAALTTTDNITDTIGDIAQWAIKRVISAYSSTELRTGVTATGRKIDGIIRAKLAADLKTYGVLVRQAFICEFSTPRFFRVMGADSVTHG